MSGHTKTLPIVFLDATSLAGIEYLKYYRRGPSTGHNSRQFGPAGQAVILDSLLDRTVYDLPRLVPSIGEFDPSGPQTIWALVDRAFSPRSSFGHIPIVIGNV